MKIDANQLKIGNIIQHKNKLWKIVKTQHTQPGKGGAYLQVELKDIRVGTKLNERFRSSESIEKIRLDEKVYQYLYKDNNGYCFMDTENYGQINIGTNIISPTQEKFLKENLNIIISSFEDTPISIQLPETIILKVIESDSVVKGQTSTSSFKPAILENNFKILVPPHIKIGDNLVISTNDGSYLMKAKD